MNNSKSFFRLVRFALTSYFDYVDLVCRRLTGNLLNGPVNRHKFLFECNEVQKLVKDLSHPVLFSAVPVIYDSFSQCKIFVRIATGQARRHCSAISISGAAKFYRFSEW
jgi:hypothetical protein